MNLVRSSFNYLQPDKLSLKTDAFCIRLVQTRKNLGLYKEDMSGVSINERVLYQARIQLPSNVTTGEYTAETFVLLDGRVIASEVAKIECLKSGSGDL